MPKKPRSIEATRLEGDYLARLHDALRHISKSEAEEIEQNVTDHIESAFAELDTEEVRLTQMAAILEELGSPESLVVEPEELPPFDERHRSFETNPPPPMPTPLAGASRGNLEFLDRLFAGYLVVVVGLFIPIIELYFCSIAGYAVIWMALRKAPMGEIVDAKRWAMASLLFSISFFPIALLTLASELFALFAVPALIGWIVSDIVLYWAVFGGLANWLESLSQPDAAQQARKFRLIYLVASLVMLALMIPVGVIAAKENDATFTLLLGFAALPVGWLIGWLLVLRPLRRIRKAVSP